VTPFGLGLKDIMLIAVPSTFIGCMLGAVAVSRIGRELADDSDYNRKVAAGEIRATAQAATRLEGAALTRARGSVIVFLSASMLVVVLGLIPSLRPRYTILDTSDVERIEQLELAPAIMMTMLAAAGINMVVFKASPDKTLKSPIMSAGIVALVSIAGLAWIGSSFFAGNRTAIVGGISHIVERAPWLFALGMFSLSALLFSQAATITTLAPVGLALGISGKHLIAMFPATAGFFLLPTYGPLIAAISFDQTGTTKIGKYVVNHSFMVPGLVAVISSIAIGFAIASLL
jgi:anaerobic C4-dicarboxylate transporter DcuA